MKIKSKKESTKTASLEKKLKEMSLEEKLAWLIKKTITQDKKITELVQKCKRLEKRMEEINCYAIETYLDTEELGQRTTELENDY